MKKRILPYLVLTSLVLSGCTPLEHLDELATLGDYAREKNNQNQLVQSTNDHYDALLKAIANKSISIYQDTTSFVYAFGQPILKKDLSGDRQEWLYRYAILKTAKDKVYVYFDHQGHFIKLEKAPCPSFF